MNLNIVNQTSQFLIICSVFLLLLASPAPAIEKNRIHFLTDEEESFLEQHWPDTIPLQGKPPETYTNLESSLSPADCGQCHPQQYKDWQTSLHSKSMGPGVLGQIIDMLDTDSETAKICWRCHTPLAEQQSVLRQQSVFGYNNWEPNPAFDRQLQHQGLVCAGCHIRNHRRFGPPPRRFPNASGRVSQDLAHEGFTATSAFSKSTFCKGCHQFNVDDYALNGKLIENTYNEWVDSQYAKKGIQCQTCHMPDRRHLWRGIHDPDMVKNGVDISTTLTQTGHEEGDTVEATITVKNSGVGHYFPTYLTPKVFIRAYFVDKNQHMVPDTIQEAVIGRDATLNLSKELFDNRIPPGEALSVIYQQRLPDENLDLLVEVEVDPDNFYRRFYQSLLETNATGKGRSFIEKALKNANESSFRIYNRIFKLK
ncbi:MAG: multiheme c-type cytochrome [Gammaproteobacteria bacterium]